MSFIHQMTLANFRCSNQPLEIEKRETCLDIDRQFRLCKICLKNNTDTVDDES